MPTLRKSALKKHLLQSVQILKRTLDYSAYCYFILAMYYFYHITDMPESFEELQNETRIMTARMTYSSMISKLQRRKQDLQDELIEAFSALENLNPSLKKVLLPSLREAYLPDAVLLEYREHLNQLQQNTGVFSSSESFSQAFEYWIAQLAKMTSRRGVAFYTQRSLVRLMVDMMKPRDGMRIYDPTAGTGGMLAGCAYYIKQQSGSLNATEFYGREQAPDIWAMCKMNLLVQGVGNAVIEQGDSLQISLDSPGTFDLVLQNMPLLPNTGSRTQTRRLHAAFLEHVLASLAPDGKAAVLSPSLILQSEYQDMWRYVVNRDWLEAVISLPASVLHGTSAPATIVVINKQKLAEHHGQVLFVMFPFKFPRRSWHNELQQEDVQPVIDAFKRWGNGLDYARVIPVSQIEEQNYSLRIEQYPDWVEKSESFDLTAALSRYRLAMQKRETAVKRLVNSLEALNLPHKKL